MNKEIINNIYLNNKHINDKLFVPGLIHTIDLEKNFIYIYTNGEKLNEYLVYESLPTLFNNIVDINMFDISLIIKHPYKIFKYVYPSDIPEIIYEESKKTQ